MLVKGAPGASEVTMKNVGTKINHMYLLGTVIQQKQSKAQQNVSLHFIGYAVPSIFPQQPQSFVK